MIYMHIWYLSRCVCFHTLCSYFFFNFICINDCYLYDTHKNWIGCRIFFMQQIILYILKIIVCNSCSPPECLSVLKMYFICMHSKFFLWYIILHSTEERIYTVLQTLHRQIYNSTQTIPNAFKWKYIIV